jgi:hypothetical protein
MILGLLIIMNCNAKLFIVTFFIFFFLNILINSNLLVSQAFWPGGNFWRLPRETSRFDPPKWGKKKKKKKKKKLAIVKKKNSNLLVCTHTNNLYKNMFNRILNTP